MKIWIQRILIGAGSELLDDNHALSSIGHVDAVLESRIQGTNLGLVLRQDGSGKIGSGIENHQTVLLCHGFHLFCKGRYVFVFFRFSGLDKGLLDGHNATALRHRLGQKGASRASDRRKHGINYLSYMCVAKWIPYSGIAVILTLILCDGMEVEGIYWHAVPQ